MESQISEQVKISENTRINEQIDSIVTVPPPIIQNLVTSYGLCNINSCYIPFVYRTPMYFPYYHQLQLYNNYSTHFMRRSDSPTAVKSNNTNAERDKKLLFEWRTWQRTQYGKHFDRKENGYESYVFTVMSFNVLAQDLLNMHPQLYKHHNRDALSWNERLKNLLFEIQQQNADILCLQEVQATHLKKYSAELKELGYEGIYKQRTGNSTVDGCAIYYKSATLELIKYTTVEYNQPNIVVLDRDNVAIIAKFAPKQNLENEFIVATTHLLYNPKREDVRLAQTQVLLTEIDRLSFKRKNNRESYHIPIIMTGDFNLKPNSPVYKLITNGVLRYEHLTKRTLLSPNSNDTNTNSTGKYFLPDTLGITDQCQHVELVDKRKKSNVVNTLDHVYLYHSDRSSPFNQSKEFNQGKFSSGVLSHHLALKSAYEHQRGNSIEATTFQSKWITVDYIFYSGVKDKSGIVMEDKLNLLARYTLPLSDQLKGVSIPNMAVGSDHFSLIAKFKLNP